MWYQASVRPEDAPRPEPEHSVPLGAGAPLVDRDGTEKWKSPFPTSPSSVARGSVIFQARCAPCHGAEGHGGGPVSKFFPPAPDLAYKTIRERSDGYLYGTVVFGGRAMPPQAEGLTNEERWDLVFFLRDLQARTPVEPAP